MRYGMNLLLWTAGVTEQHLPLLEKMKGWGFDGVELPLFDAPMPGLPQRLDDLELGRTAVTVCSAETNPIDPDPAVRQAALDYLKQRIDWCAEVGVEVLCGPLHSALGVLPGRGRTDEEWGWCVEVLRQAAEHAGPTGVKLSVEPLNRFEVYFLNTMADADRLVAEVGHPSLGYLYDTFHANIEECDVAESVTANARGINHVHVSENHRGTPGTGHVHWDATFRALKQVGYDGWMTIEAFGRALPELAAATRIWRDLFESEDQLAEQGGAFIRSRFAAA
jgi:D-psicose/D-tagatose/L-ribulose 3-epimerase